MSTEAVEAKEKGALYLSLERGNKQIREERGNDLVEVLKVAYERKAQDHEMEINSLRRKQRSMFDFGGTSTTSLVVKDVDSLEIMTADLDIELKIHNLEVKLSHVKKRLAHLFINEIKSV